MIFGKFLPLVVLVAPTAINAFPFANANASPAQSGAEWQEDVQDVINSSSDDALKLLKRNYPQCKKQEKKCGNTCIQKDYTCCPGKKIGCSSQTQVCSLRWDGDYICCPKGKPCKARYGPAGKAPGWGGGWHKPTKSSSPSKGSDKSPSKGSDYGSVQKSKGGKTDDEDCDEEDDRKKGKNQSGGYKQKDNGKKWGSHKSKGDRDHGRGGNKYPGSKSHQSGGGNHQGGGSYHPPGSGGGWQPSQDDYST